MSSIGSTNDTTPQAVPTAVEAARAAFENAQGEIPPRLVPVLLAGGREIVRLPQPRTETDRKILRFLDNSYGQQAWLRDPPTWEERVGADDDDCRRIAEFEQEIAAKLDETMAKRAEYVNCEREIRRLQHLLAKAPLDHERGRIILPPGEDLSVEAFQKLDRDLKRREKVYVTALEAYQDAKGALTEYKLKVQDRWVARELARSQRAAREEQERRGVRWADR
jgi:hypothetical protein